MFDWMDMYSAKNLRKRAARLEECPYKLVLQLAADQVERGKATSLEARKALELVQTNDPDLISVAMKMLHLNQGQVTVAINLLKKMK